MAWRPWLSRYLAATFLALDACGGGASRAGTPQAGGAPVPLAFAPSAPPLALTSDPARRTVRFTMVGSFDHSNGGMNFNGHSRGALVVSVPAGWTVILTCRNNGPLTHSCVVVNSPGASGPALPGASTASPVTGLRAGQSATLTFTVATPAVYRIACLVPGHEAAGMWETLRVKASGSPTATVVQP